MCDSGGCECDRAGGVLRRNPSEGRLAFSRLVWGLACSGACLLGGLLARGKLGRGSRADLAAERCGGLARPALFASRPNRKLDVDSQEIGPQNKTLDTRRNSATLALSNDRPAPLRQPLSKPSSSALGQPSANAALSRSVRPSDLGRQAAGSRAKTHFPACTRSASCPARARR